MAFDKGAANPNAADTFIRGKSAHQLLALIAAGELPKGITPADVGRADVERTARKASQREEAAA